MRILKPLESKQHGTPDFPFGYYQVDKDHPNFQMPFHWHTEFEILLVRTGRFTLTLNGETKTLYAGDMAFIGGGALHGGYPSGEDCLYECVVFDLSILNQGIVDPRLDDILRDRARILPFLSVTDSRETWEAVTRLMNTAKIQGDHSGALICLGILYEILGTLFLHGLTDTNTKEDSQDIKRWKTLLHYIESHYSEKITLEMMATAAGLSPKYLCRAFARLTGNTPLAYLNEYRLDRACEMLRNTDETILSIAISCGFNDQSYFVKQFRNSRGITPGAYRKQ